MKKLYLRLLWLGGFFLFLLVSTVSESAYEAFHRKDYDAELFFVSKKRVKKGSLSIHLIQVRRKISDFNKYPEICRAWLQVNDNGHIRSRRYYPNIQAVGGDFGLYVSKSQPFKDYVLIKKFGDYEDLVLLIGNDGKIMEIPGDNYFVSKDKRFLFAQAGEETPNPEIVIFDVKNNRLYHNPLRRDYVERWYELKGKYFFLISPISKDDSKDKTYQTYVFDPQTADFEKGKVKGKDLSKAKRLYRDLSSFSANGNCRY